MSHNIQTAGQASGMENSWSNHAPVVGPLWQNPVLTIGEGSPYSKDRPTVTMLFHGGNYPADAHIVVNPWHMDNDGTTIHIGGEDLYALRALLAEFPEEAFKEPAPSIPAYEEGDRVMVKDPTYGNKAGRVVVAEPDGSLYIEGPKVDEVRIMAWSIEADKVSQYVSPLA